MKRRAGKREDVGPALGTGKCGCSVNQRSEKKEKSSAEEWRSVRGGKGE